MKVRDWTSVTVDVVVVSEWICFLQPEGWSASYCTGENQTNVTLVLLSYVFCKPNL